jgi:hypothetical protein
MLNGRSVCQSLVIPRCLFVDWIENRQTGISFRQMFFEIAAVSYLLSDRFVARRQSRIPSGREGGRFECESIGSNATAAIMRQLVGLPYHFPLNRQKSLEGLLLE